MEDVNIIFETLKNFFFIWRGSFAAHLEGQGGAEVSVLQTYQPLSNPL